MSLEDILEAIAKEERELAQLMEQAEKDGVL
jgi:hypothetical protein